MKQKYWLVVALLLAGCASYEQPEVALVGLAPLESTLLEPRMRLDFRLLNPGRKALAVRGVDMILEVNGIEFARGVDGQGFQLPAFGETRASVEVSASILNLVQILLSVPKVEEFSYELRGRLHVKGVPGSIPLRRSGAITRGQLQALGGSGGKPGTLRLE